MVILTTLSRNGHLDAFYETFTEYKSWMTKEF